jgi:hypothetical protein
MQSTSLSRTLTIASSAGLQAALPKYFLAAYGKPKSTKAEPFTASVPKAESIVPQFLPRLDNPL